MICSAIQGAETTKHAKAECVHAQKRAGTAARESLRRDCPGGPCHLHSTLAATPILFAHAVLTVDEKQFLCPCCYVPENTAAGLSTAFAGLRSAFENENRRIPAAMVVPGRVVFSCVTGACCIGDDIIDDLRRV